MEFKTQMEAAAKEHAEQLKLQDTSFNQIIQLLQAIIKVLQKISPFI
jgi:hypothetical protein